MDFFSEENNDILRSCPLHYFESEELPQYLQRTSGRYWKSGDIVKRVFYLLFNYNYNKVLVKLNSVRKKKEEIDCFDLATKGLAAGNVNPT